MTNTNAVLVAHTEQKQPDSSRQSKATENSQGNKRYNLVIPEPLYNELEKIADREMTTVLSVLRTFIKMGLLIDKVNTSDDGKILLREKNVDEAIRFIYS